MFEADRIPGDWVKRAKQHERILVPTEACRLAWVDSGVPFGCRTCRPPVMPNAGPPKTIVGTSYGRCRFESLIPDELEPAIAQRVQRAVEDQVARRIWQKDESLWGGPGVPEIGNRLGWLTIADKMLEGAGDLKLFADGCVDAGLTDAVLLGMGGSSLAPEVFRRSSSR